VAFPPQNVVVIAEDGGDLDGAADRLDVAGDGVAGGHLAALDLGDATLVYAHALGGLRLGQAQGLAASGKPVPVDVGLVAVACLGDGFLAADPGDDVVADVLPPGANSVIVFLPPRAP
jgi:hypothetical protein